MPASKPNHEHPQERNFRQSMRVLREAKGWSQADLARQLAKAGLDEFHQTTIARMEKGTRAIRLGEAVTISQVLGTSVESMRKPSGDLGSIVKLTSRRRELVQAQIELTASVRKYYEAAYNFFSYAERIIPKINVKNLDQDSRYDLDYALRTKAEIVGDRYFNKAISIGQSMANNSNNISDRFKALLNLPAKSTRGFEYPADDAENGADA